MPALAMPSYYIISFRLYAGSNINLIIITTKVTHNTKVMLAYNYTIISMQERLKFYYLI